MNNSDFSFSQEGLINRVLYYAEKNDINFFVEDLYKEYEYETLFRRMFNDEIRINTIFPTGGKEALIEAFNVFGPHYVATNIYLADGDFDKIIEINTVNNKNFIYLESYNIENYYIDFDATLLYLKGKLRNTELNILPVLKFDEWLIKITDQLYELFVLFCLIKKYKPQVQSISSGPFKYLDSSSGFINQCAFEDYLSMVRMELDEFDDKITEIKERCSQMNGIDKSKMICGKYYFESLVLYLRNTFNISFKKEDFKWFLICHFKVDKLNYVRKRIIESLNN